MLTNEGLVFEPAGHTYRLWGAVIPSVSEVIAPLGDDLKEESGPLAGALENAAERGTICHEILAQLLHGETEIEYPQDYEPYVQSAMLFVAEHDIEPLAVETPVHSEEWLFAGTPDLLARFDGRLALLDYKFVAQLAKTRVKAQLNAYQKCYAERGVAVEKLYAVQFLPGTYRLYEVPIDGKEIEACLTLWHLKHMTHPRGKIS